MPNFHIGYCIWDLKTNAPLGAVLDLNFVFNKNKPIVERHEISAIECAFHPPSMAGANTVYDPRKYHISSGIYEQAPLAFLVPIDMDQLPIGSGKAFFSVNVTGRVRSYFNTINQVTRVVPAPFNYYMPQGIQSSAPYLPTISTPISVIYTPTIDCDKETDKATDKLMKSSLTKNNGQCPKCGSCYSSFVRMALVCDSCKTMIGGI